MLWLVALAIIVFAITMLIVWRTSPGVTRQPLPSTPTNISFDTRPQLAPTRQNFIALATCANDIYSLAVPNTAPTAEQIQAWATAHGLTEAQLLYSTEAILNVSLGVKSQPLGLIAKVARDPKNAVVIYRGSKTIADWIYNINFTLTDLQTANRDFPSGAMINRGYAQLYSSAVARTVKGCTCSSQCTNLLGQRMCLTQGQCGRKIGGRYYDTCLPASAKSLGDTIRDWVSAHPEVTNYMLTGHSLGCTVATLTALHLRVLGKPVSCVYTFASPRLGNPAFAKLYNSYVGAQTFRFAYSNDPVPILPLPITPIPNNCFQHVGLNHYQVEWWPEMRCDPLAITLAQHTALINPALLEYTLTSLRL